MKDGSKTPLPSGDIYRHMWLMKSVSAAIGVDLGVARAEGRLNTFEYSRMLTNCRSADCDKSCALWVTQQQGIAKVAPEFCVNSEALKRLKR